MNSLAGLTIIKTSRVSMETSKLSLWMKCAETAVPGWVKVSPSPFQRCPSAAPFWGSSLQTRSPLWLWRPAGHKKFTATARMLCMRCGGGELTEVLTLLSFGGSRRLFFQSSPNLMPPPSWGAPPAFWRAPKPFPWLWGAGWTAGGLFCPRSCPFCLFSPMTIGPTFSVLAVAIFFSWSLLEFFLLLVSSSPATKFCLLGFQFFKNFLQKIKKKSNKALANNILCSFPVQSAATEVDYLHIHMYVQFGPLQQQSDWRTTTTKVCTQELFKMKINLHSNAWIYSFTV